MVNPNLNSQTIYKQWTQIFSDHTINLAAVEFCDPWAIGTICLKAIEFAQSDDKRLILPEKGEELTYFRRMHLAEFFSSLTYRSFLTSLEGVTVAERENTNIQEVLYCQSMGEFDARLSSRIRIMFKTFGLSDTEEQLATGLVGELGNNVFDHNLGVWPTINHGAIIIAQNYPKTSTIHVVVADPGVGFFGSLLSVKPDLASDVEAIRLGLSGVTGRVGERRGNGLRLIQDWTINRFQGILRIQSGRGLVTVDKSGIRDQDVPPVVGTIAELTIKQM